MTDLRSAQREVTRERIVRAVSDLVAHDHPATISVPAVAARAGVGVATIYRYFPTKEALLDAAAHGAVSASAGQLPGSLGEVGPALQTAWRELAEQLPLVRGQFASPVGRDLHRRRWEVRRRATASYLRDEGLDSGSPAAQRFMGVTDVLTSSTALLELHDTVGASVDEAAEWCAWAVAVLLEASREAAR